MKVYAAMYSSCIYEGGLSILSLHENEANAQARIDEHKEAEQGEWDRVYADETDKPNICDYQAWIIEEFEVHQ
jgi:hypothetical protein